MIRGSRLVGVAAGSAAGLLAAGALALPPPMSDQELMDAADLVVDGQGVSIECDGEPVTDAQKTTTYYLAVVEPTQTLKGPELESVEVSGQEVDWQVAMAGPWAPDPVAVGWSGRLYLEDNGDGTYSEVWWNGFEPDATSAPEPLPSCGGAGAGGAGGQPVGGAGGLAGAAPAGGTSGAAPTGGSSGAAPTGGAAGTATSGGAAGSDDSDEESGCACRAASGSPPAAPSALLSLAALCASRLRRPRRRSRR